MGPPPGPAGVVAGAVVVTLAGVVTVVVTVEVDGLLLLLPEPHPAVNVVRAITVAVPATTVSRRGIPLLVMCSTQSRSVSNVLVHLPIRIGC